MIKHLKKFYSDLPVFLQVLIKILFVLTIILIELNLIQYFLEERFQCDTDIECQREYK